MGWNFGYHWQQRQNKHDAADYERRNWNEKKKRKKLSKGLRAIKVENAHIVDDEMFENIKQMLNSVDRKDKVMAYDIIWNSKLRESQITYFVHNHLDLLLYGVPEESDDDLNMWTYVGGPTASFAPVSSSNTII